MTPKKKKIQCKNCGTIINPAETPPKKTWNLISPMPDKNGNVTVTIMGSFYCPECGKNVRSSIQKIKGDEVEASKSFKKSEILLETLNNCDERTPIESIAEVVGLSEDKVEKAVNILIKRKKISGKLQDGDYIPS